MQTDASITIISCVVATAFQLCEWDVKGQLCEQMSKWTSVEKMQMWMGDKENMCALMNIHVVFLCSILCVLFLGKNVNI